MARPVKQSRLDRDQIRHLASIGATDADIALLAGLSERTLQTRFRTQLTEGRAQKRIRLLAAMTKRLEAGSDRILIWLSQQWLDMRPAAPRPAEPQGDVTIRIVNDDDDNDA